MSGERRLQWTAVDCQDHAAGLDIASITLIHCPAAGEDMGHDHDQRAE